MTDMNTLWPTLTAKRAEIYQWFASLFALELTEMQIEAYQNEAIAPLLTIFNESGFEAETIALQEAIEDWKNLGTEQKEIQLELAADFAALFLLDAKRAALPYASHYLEKDGNLFGHIETAMQKLLADNQLAVDQQFNEPADHLAIILTVLAKWNSKPQSQDPAMMREIATTQIQFIDDALLSWLPQFVAKGKNVLVKSRFYPAIMALLLAYVEEDRQLLIMCQNEEA